MTDIPSQAVWSRCPDVAFVDDGNRVVVLALANPWTSRTMLLDGPAAVIWRLLTEPAGTCEVCERIAAIYERSPNSVEREVQDVLEALVTVFLVERQPAKGP